MQQLGASARGVLFLHALRIASMQIQQIIHWIIMHYCPSISTCMQLWIGPLGDLSTHALPIPLARLELWRPFARRPGRRARRPTHAQGDLAPRPLPPYT